MNYKRFQSNLIHLSAIDSTNNYAANLLKTSNVVNGTTILTKRQDKGRGQSGNIWQTDPNKNLIASTIIFPKLKSGYLFYLNIAVSLAVAKTLEDIGINAKVKWPNDIYVGQNKIAGILIENQIQGKWIKNSIIGVGLNVNQVFFLENSNATSVFNEINKELDVLDIFEHYFGYLDFYVDHLMNSNFELLLKRYYQLLFRYKEMAFYEDLNGVFEGEIVGIDSVGRLLIKTKTDLKVYSLKEVKHCFD